MACVCTEWNTGTIVELLLDCLGFMYLWDLAGVLPRLRRTGIEARLADGTPLTTRPDGGAFVLEAGRSDRWAQRDHAAFGTPPVVDALLADLLGGPRGAVAIAPESWGRKQQRSSFS
jgi:hypothetical protein